jgi:hypothetical protein
MWRHEFYAICPQGHKRNFTWGDNNQTQFKSVKEYCHLCEEVVEFIVKMYFKDPEEETE